MKGKEREPRKKEFQLIDEPNPLNDKYIRIFVLKDRKSASWISN